MLTGRWVTLEPLSAARHSHAIWQAVLGHEEVWRWLGDGPYLSEEDLAVALAAKETGAAARFFAILPKSDPTAKGYASLMRMDPANGVIEVGNVMFSPWLQRTPAATEAMYLMARYVFDELGYRRYEWKCNALNLPSRRAAERLGFTFEGIFRQHMVVKGQNRDTAWYAMLDSEWPARKRAFEAWLAPENFDAEERQRKTLSSLAGNF
ncbi:GNAT family N-acetyltransferase [Acidicapsa acidisoli]|uniref:GNAT family N-acetyltransferase n=1 Tax=Acidicapsa acidisoli TaxID=1615681 RepID=UPI0021DF5087|nr:GNAT family protein [Acidicapsa acidisoli]